MLKMLPCSANQVSVQPPLSQTRIGATLLMMQGSAIWRSLSAVAVDLIARPYRRILVGAEGRVSSAPRRRHETEDTMTSGRALIEEIDGLAAGARLAGLLVAGSVRICRQDTGHRLLHRPISGPSRFRNVPPLLDPADITNADWVLGTHDHGDHIDTRSLPRYRCGLSAGPLRLLARRHAHAFSPWASRRSA